VHDRLEATKTGFLLKERDTAGLYSGLHLQTPDVGTCDTGRLHDALNLTVTELVTLHCSQRFFLELSACRILGSNNGGYEEFSLLGYQAIRSPLKVNRCFGRKYRVYFQS
jgi:hypothetical protein